VGYYSVATQFADMLAILPQSTALVLFPHLVGERRGRFDRTIWSLSAMAVLLGTGCIAVAWLAEPLITIAFGGRFLPAATVLRCLLPGVFFLGLTGVASQYLAAIGFPRALVLIWFAGFAAAVTTSWLLIPRFAGTGAALALSLTHGLVLTLILGLGWMKHRAGIDCL